MADTKKTEKEKTRKEVTIVKKSFMKKLTETEIDSLDIDLVKYQKKLRLKLNEFAEIEKPHKNEIWEMKRTIKRLTNNAASGTEPILVDVETTTKYDSKGQAISQVLKRLDTGEILKPAN